MSDAASAMTTTLRRVLPVLLLPLGLVACGLAGAPWLRAYPAAVLAAPLFGAALLSVLLPFVVVNIGVRKLWQTALISLVGYLFFVTLVALREPTGYADLWAGLVHGPSQILSFALPLVSPRTLLVVPVTLCWLCGAVVGECIGRNWQSVLPYGAVLVTFGLAYAATQRAVNNVDGRRYDTLLAGGVLLALLLLRAVQAWVDQNTDRPVYRGAAAAAEPGTQLPLRSAAVGALVAVLVTAVAAAAVQSDVFTGPATVPARIPPINRSQPLSPLAFVAGLRPADPHATGAALFTLTVDQAASRYITLGDVDSYSGDSWSFAGRTFRPSGGVVPAPADPTLRQAGSPVTQQYDITAAALAKAPWMPFLYRPRRVVGTAVDIDPDSGMIVPARGLHAGQRYSVVSDAAPPTLGQLPRHALPASSPGPNYLQLPTEVASTLSPVIKALQREAGVPSSDAVPFLQALSADLHQNYGLAGAPPGARPPASSSPNSSASATPGHRASASPSASPAPAPSPTATPSASGSATVRIGGTSYAAVLASILGSSRTATPEQYATLVALIARALNVPARVVTGFRLPQVGTSPATVPAGSYTVTTGDAWTWVEVAIAGHGWTVLDPTPSAGSRRAPPSSAGPSATPRPSSPPPTNALVTQPNPSQRVAQGRPGKVSKPRSVPVSQIALLTGGGLVLLALLILVVLLLRKSLRVRRRRRSGNPRRRIVAAWQESLDVLMEAGLPEVSALTSREVADAAEQRFGPDPGARARYLGAAANVAIFSPTTWLDAEAADQAWQAQGELRRAVRRRLTFGQRVGARLRYHRVPHRAPLVGPESWTAAARAGAEEIRRSAGRHSVGRRH